MRIHQLTVEEALASLNATITGLSAAEAARRMAEFGPNEVTAVEQESWLVRMARHVTHFFALILWFAAGLAFVAEYYQPDQGMALLGVAILAVIIINGAFSFWQEYRAERALAALQYLLPHEVMVQRAGRLHKMPVRALVPGDLIYLGAGDNVPADCRVIKAYAAKVNTATVTGESLPTPVNAESSNATDLLQASNVLLAGTALVGGEAEAVVFATGMRTEFGRLAHLTQATRKIVSPLQQEIARLSRWVALLAAALGVIFFIIGQAMGLSFWANMLFAIGIIVASVPEGLLPTVTLALAMAAQRMARRNALIRHLPSVETLGSTTVICTDKTGTLTQNRLQVQRLYVDGAIVDADTWQGVATAPLLQIAAHCHTLGAANADVVRGGPIDPLEAALVNFSERQEVSAVAERVYELPFDSERRCMSVLIRQDQQLVLYSKGALEALLPNCSALQHGDEIITLTDTCRSALLEAEEQLASDGLRVIALAYRKVNASYVAEQLEQGLVLAGLVALEDPPRPEVSIAVAQCHSAGIKVIMVTGDHPHTAVSIAREIGLVHSMQASVISGEQLERLNDTQLQLALDSMELIFARISAEQKRRIVATLRAKGEIVAVTGDGVNDAPALREAHIGIAMGLTGTDVAKEAADMVLLDDNFASIVAAIEEGRGVFDNIRKFLTYILTSNIPEIVPYLAFALLRIPLPLTVIQILAVDLGTDMLPALALGAERPSPEVLKQPPRRASQRLVDVPMIARAYLFLGLLEATAAMAAYFFVLHSSGWRYGDMLAADDHLYQMATTSCLASIVVMQVVNVWLCRSDRASVLTRGTGANPLILWGIGFELGLILAIVYTPLGNVLFGTAPIAMNVWLFVLPFAMGMLLLEEARKAWLRRTVKKAPSMN